MNSIGIDDSVLIALEKSLKEIELEHAISGETPNSSGHSSDGDLDDTYSSDVSASSRRGRQHRPDTKAVWDDGDSFGDDSDDENPEQELSAMMNILVAELQAEIQDQIIQEIEESESHEEIAEATANITESISPPNPEEFVEVQDYTAIQDDSKASDDVAPVVEGAVSCESESIPSPTPAPKESGASLRASLSKPSINRNELITILQNHLSVRRQESVMKQKEWNVQPIPDLSVSEATANFEPMARVQPTDPDYVPVSDYSPKRRTRRSKREKKANKLAENDVSALSMPNLVESSPGLHQQSPTSLSHLPERRHRTRKHHPKRHLKKRRQLEQLIFDCAVPEHESRDDAIRKLADSSLWLSICKITFQGKI